MPTRFNIRYIPKAVKLLQTIPKPYKNRIIEKIEALALNPYHGKKLHGDFAGHYVVRAWPYRIIYTINKDIVLHYCPVKNQKRVGCGEARARALERVFGLR